VLSTGRCEMTLTADQLSKPPIWLGRLFDRIACGVDGADSSDVAVAQAVRLLAARKTLKLVAVVEPSSRSRRGQADSAELERTFQEAQRAVREGRVRFPHAQSSVLFGAPGPALCAAARDAEATLLAIGAPASGRLAAKVLGGVGTYVLQWAPCSILIARARVRGAEFPRSIVVGNDGSAYGVAATLVARELAHRFDANLRVVLAAGGKPVQAGLLALEGELEWSPEPPVDALLRASAGSDLLVVGSRGLHGVRALGSVSERVGHLALSSVLVVREPAGFTLADAIRRTDDEVPDLEC
jgi:nucleotide-binding universal stress UspA family protein